MFTRSTATSDVYIKFFPEGAYQLILVAGVGGGGAIQNVL